MLRRSTLALTSMALLCFAVALAGNAAAQQKEKVSFKAAAENSKFTQQQNIDVGDVPNHIVRIYEIHGTYPSNAPVIYGLKLVEDWNRGIGDRIDGSGDGTFYTVYVMENGDKFFARGRNVVLSTSEKFSSTNVGFITGGTGKFAAIQGIVRGSSSFDYKTNFFESQVDIEYSIGK
jgi:hypothetical protein